MKHIAILGSTGSVGRQAMDVIEKFPNLFKVELIAAAHMSSAIISQINQYSPSFVYTCVGKYDGCKDSICTNSETDLYEFLNSPKIDLILSAISGTSGIKPTYEAILTGKEVAIANKESWVSAGKFLKQAAKKSGALIIPVDSEHSAAFQAIGKDRKTIKKVILTASGGPFHSSLIDLSDVTVGDVLNHPVWNMGEKITVDSATLLNKGFEIIEACELFDLQFDDIDVFIHRQGIVHSLVSFTDGTIIAQMGRPDMRIPISYAMNYPNRLPGQPYEGDGLTFEQIKEIRFELPTNIEKRVIKLVKRAWEAGVESRIVLNIADEVAVNLFLEGKIRFVEIVDFVENRLNNEQPDSVKNIDDVIELTETLQRKFSTIIDMRKANL